MTIKDFIKAKEKSEKNTEEDINYFIKNLQNFSQEEITRWLKAVKTNGLNDEETTILTKAMAYSGTVLNWDDLEPVIDKHSTGGIGDKITLLFVPLLSAYGINIPKLSGRSLGITGGTIDKLESIPGFKTALSIDDIKKQVKNIGLAICSASIDLAPADKILYAIRDVTDTVDSIPLISSSIMSKKIAAGAKNIILDVKCGSGAFMKNLHDARLLAEKMVLIGKSLNKNIKAVISNMDEPLGNAIGNTLEIKEVIEVLSGKNVPDLVEIVISLACEAISIIKPKTELNIEKKLVDILLNGDAYKKFESMIISQDGDLNAIFKEEKKARHIEPVKSTCDGYIQNIDAHLFGEAVFNLGAGRKTVSDRIDDSVGIIFNKKHGDYVKAGELLFEIHAKNKKDADSAKNYLSPAIRFTDNSPTKPKLIYKIVE